MKGPRKIQITLSRQASSAVDELMTTGLFGTSRAGIVRELVGHRLRELASEGWCTDLGIMPPTAKGKVRR